MPGIGGGACRPAGRGAQKVSQSSLLPAALPAVAVLRDSLAGAGSLAVALLPVLARAAVGRRVEARAG